MYLKLNYNIDRKEVINMLEITITTTEKFLLEESNLFDRNMILDFCLYLTCGNIKNITMQKKKKILDFEISIEEKIEELNSKLKGVNQVRIWYCSNNGEQLCTLYFLIDYISNYSNIDIYTCDVSDEYCNSLACYSENEIKGLLDLTKKITNIDEYKKIWKKLEQENNELRVIENNMLVSKPFSYLDNKMINILEKYDKVEYNHFIGGECMKNMLCGIHMDIFFAYRIEEMIKNGIIEIAEQKEEYHKIRGYHTVTYIRLKNQR